MLDWWSNLPAFEKIFWYFAIPFSLVFLVRLISALTGFGGSDDDGDSSDLGEFEEGSNFLEDFRLFTLQNFIIFFTGFGWGGIYAVNTGFSPSMTVVFAFFIGLFLMFSVAGMFYLITRLSESGNINLSNALNTTGRVYLPIPGHKSGTGQVQISVQGSFREVAAMTEGDALPTGTPIKVTSVVNQEILMVKRTDKAAAKNTQ
jgi:hypothetical protein